MTPYSSDDENVKVNSFITLLEEFNIKVLMKMLKSY